MEAPLSDVVWLNRKQAATRLGLSISGLRGRVRAGALDEFKAVDGSPRYDAGQVDRLVKSQPSRKVDRRYIDSGSIAEGELHARAFEHFKIVGTDLREAVIKLRIPDDEVERLAARWHAHGGELFLGSAVVGNLRKLLPSLPESLSDNTVLTAIKGALSANTLTIDRLSDDIHTRDTELAALHEAKLRVERDAAEAEQDATAEATQLATALRAAREQLAAREEQIRSLRAELSRRAPQEPIAGATSPSPGPGK